MSPKAAKPVVDESIISEVERGADLRVRVRSVSVDGEVFVDIREYIPSTETYGRGIMLPRSLGKALAAAMRAA